MFERKPSSYPRATHPARFTAGERSARRRQALAEVTCLCLVVVILAGTVVAIWEVMKGTMVQ